MKRAVGAKKITTASKHSSIATSSSRPTHVGNYKNTKPRSRWNERQLASRPGPGLSAELARSEPPSSPHLRYRAQDQITPDLPRRQNLIRFATAPRRAPRLKGVCFADSELLAQLHGCGIWTGAGR
eukprot:COSAG02_NODE_6578_length_3482_cov_5.503104_1_plen_126_part_00